MADDPAGAPQPAAEPSTTPIYDDLAAQYFPATGRHSEDAPTGPVVSARP